MCALRYNVAESETNTFWASDLMHRLYHMPAFGENHVEHYAEDYQGVRDMAQHNATWSTSDSDALQYFALEVYAYDIAVPGVGCPGPSNATAEGSQPTGAAGTTPTPESASTTTSAVAVSDSTNKLQSESPRLTGTRSAILTQVATCIALDLWVSKP